MDLIESGKLATDAVRFFVLDEADRLLDTGNLDTILKMFARLPKNTAGAARLQVRSSEHQISQQRDNGSPVFNLGPCSSMGSFC